MKYDSERSWNYRVYRSIDPNTQEACYYILEVHYVDEEIISYSADPIPPFGNTDLELKQDLQLMLLAFNLPVLTDVDLPPCH